MSHVSSRGDVLFLSCCGNEYLQTPDAFSWTLTTGGASDPAGGRDKSSPVSLCHLSYSVRAFLITNLLESLITQRLRFILSYLLAVGSGRMKHRVGVLFRGH